MFCSKTPTRYSSKAFKVTNIPFVPARAGTLCCGLSGPASVVRGITLVTKIPGRSYVKCRRKVSLEPRTFLQGLISYTPKVRKEKTAAFSSTTGTAIVMDEPNSTYYRYPSAWALPPLNDESRYWLPWDPYLILLLTFLACQKNAVVAEPWRRRMARCDDHSQIDGGKRTFRKN